MKFLTATCAIHRSRYERCNWKIKFQSIFQKICKEKTLLLYLLNVFSYLLKMSAGTKSNGTTQFFWPLGDLKIYNALADMEIVKDAQVQAFKKPSSYMGISQISQSIIKNHPNKILKGLSFSSSCNKSFLAHVTSWHNDTYLPICMWKNVPSD